MMKSGRYRVLNPHHEEGSADTNCAAEMVLLVDNFQNKGPLTTLTGTAKDGENGIKGMSLIQQKKLRSLKRNEHGPNSSNVKSISAVQKQAMAHLNNVSAKSSSASALKFRDKRLSFQQRKSEPDLTFLAASASSWNLPRNSVDFLSEAEKIAQNSSKNFIAPLNNEGTEIPVEAINSKTKPIINPHLQQYLHNFYMTQQNPYSTIESTSPSAAAVNYTNYRSISCNQFDTASCLSASSGYSSSSNSSNGGSLRSTSAMSLTRHSDNLKNYTEGNGQPSYEIIERHREKFSHNSLLSNVSSSPDSSLSINQRMSSSDDSDFDNTLLRRKIVQCCANCNGYLLEDVDKNFREYSDPDHSSLKTLPNLTKPRSHNGIPNTDLVQEVTLADNIQSSDEEKDPITFEDVDIQNTILIPPLENLNLSVENLAENPTKTGKNICRCPRNPLKEEVNLNSMSSDDYFDNENSKHNYAMNTDKSLNYTSKDHIIQKHLDSDACQQFFRTRYSKTKIFWRRNLQGSVEDGSINPNASIRYKDNPLLNIEKVKSADEIVDVLVQSSQGEVANESDSLIETNSTIGNSNFESKDVVFNDNLIDSTVTEISSPFNDFTPKLSKSARKMIMEEFDTSSEKLNAKMIILRREIAHLIAVDGRLYSQLSDIQTKVRCMAEHMQELASIANQRQDDDGLSDCSETNEIDSDSLKIGEALDEAMCDEQMMVEASTRPEVQLSLDRGDPVSQVDDVEVDSLEYQREMKNDSIPHSNEGANLHQSVTSVNGVILPPTGLLHPGGKCSVNSVSVNNIAQTQTSSIASENVQRVSQEPSASENCRTKRKISNNSSTMRHSEAVPQKSIYVNEFFSGPTHPSKENANENLPKLKNLLLEDDNLYHLREGEKVNDFNLCNETDSLCYNSLSDIVKKDRNDVDRKLDSITEYEYVVQSKDRVERSYIEDTFEPDSLNAVNTYEEIKTIPEEQETAMDSLQSNISHLSSGSRSSSGSQSSSHGNSFFGRSRKTYAPSMRNRNRSSVKSTTSYASDRSENSVWTLNEEEEAIFEAVNESLIEENTNTSSSKRFFESMLADDASPVDSLDSNNEKLNSQIEMIQKTLTKNSMSVEDFARGSVRSKYRRLAVLASSLMEETLHQTEKNTFGETLTRTNDQSRQFEAVNATLVNKVCSQNGDYKNDDNNNRFVQSSDFVSKIPSISGQGNQKKESTHKKIQMVYPIQHCKSQNLSVYSNINSKSSSTIDVSSSITPEHKFDKPSVMRSKSTSNTVVLREISKYENGVPKLPNPRPKSSHLTYSSENYASNWKSTCDKPSKSSKLPLAEKLMSTISKKGGRISKKEPVLKDPERSIVISAHTNYREALIM